NITGKTLSVEEQAALSRQGSGSSCRSFFDGFVEWDGADRIRPLVTGPNPFVHQVFIVSTAVKSVSSSQAHLKVATSLLMPGRTERAITRLEKTKALLVGQLDWRELFELCWAEFWDMHALFETSQPAFGYFTPESLDIIYSAREYWQVNNDGPIVTMDAGPNVHLLWRQDQKDLAKKFASDFDFQVFSNMESV
ncbi:MAG: diphosphomevalonate decarboxylase, partial [Bdellovibrionaceae bacterium]|nr:diphosphomevalonate decarboxylase [Pseudobdellovibrionaceae bacterium]